MVYLRSLRCLKRICLLAAIFSFFSVSHVMAAGMDLANRTRNIDSGKIEGAPSEKEAGVTVFRGIPYAAPPVGDFRWRPPQPVKAWEGVRDGSRFGAVCAQPKSLLPGMVEEGRMSEDCLYLNVWTPAKNAGENLPVMVWIHGGGNLNGSGSAPFYDGANLAKKGVVVVTFNYRLGPFGFFAHPLLSKESGLCVSGNYGILDQIAALKWVQKNIRAFGGNPGCVTIFGESAGGLNVNVLMASPLAKGLFHRAISESGTALRWNRHLREKWHGRESMEAQGERLAKELVPAGAKDALKALRSLPMEKILIDTKPVMGELRPGGNSFNFVVDGWLVPDDVQKIFDEGKQNDVPLIVGANADEGTLFITQSSIKTVDGYRSTIKTLFPSSADGVLALYPVTEPAQIRKALADVFGDSWFVCPARVLARGMASVESKAYLYHFTMKPSGRLGGIFGATHGSEIPYVFDNLGQRLVKPDESRLALARSMSGYWVQFAKTGDPNAAGMVQWPAFTPEADVHLEFGPAIKTGRNLRKAACDLFDQSWLRRN